MQVDEQKARSDCGAFKHKKKDGQEQDTEVRADGTTHTTCLGHRVRKDGPLVACGVVYMNLCQVFAMNVSKVPFSVHFILCLMYGLANPAIRSQSGAPRFVNPLPEPGPPFYHLHGLLPQRRPQNCWR